MTTILAFILMLGVLIFFHELGHFLAARSVGVRVERFYIGFNLFGLGIKKKIGHTEYGLGLFPLGGYVKMAGMVDESMDTTITGEPWEFQSKNTLQKIWIMSAGVIANLILAVVVFTAVTFADGVIENDPAPIVGALVPGYPAEGVGMQADDNITAINGHNITSWAELTALIHSVPDEIIEVTWERSGETFHSAIKTRATETWVRDEFKTVGLIGIEPKGVRRSVGIGEAVVSGFTTTRRWFVITYKSLGMIVTGKASLRDIGGPIMIAQLAGQSAQTGLASFLRLLAIISINLAFINILPIPALDGGQIAVVLIEAGLRRPLSVKVRMAIQQVGMMLLLTLMVVVIYNDIMRIFK
ncbi:MAG: RIP metalloprotease RseP [Candidatus Marinimicrobia bacterium]|nr:RIP metalloprotease RseP [Candidatus Neomarinimicrobiota bacterium]